MFTGQGTHFFVKKIDKKCLRMTKMQFKKNLNPEFPVKYLHYIKDFSL